MTSRAVVFAYHNVGVRCLSVLLGQGVEVPLVVTHRDNPSERIWFDSVAQLAARHDIPVVTPGDPAAVAANIGSLAPDFLFSFYYRHMLPPALLKLPARGALNMHGSLLPNYRGRVPVNWAIIRGETGTGASLHYMVEKPDAGDLVDQQSVPILPDDTALEVFQKVTVATELVLHRSLPGLLAGTAPRVPLDLSRGSYFGGRKPEDGRIDWTGSARSVHDLVRAVAPPYPGAFCDIQGVRVTVHRTVRESGMEKRFASPTLFAENERCYAQCGDGAILRLEAVEIPGRMAGSTGWVGNLPALPLPLI